MTRGMDGAEVCFHSAAMLGDAGSMAAFRRINVGGTKSVIDACRLARVRRLVHVGTEAALMHGQPLVAADERTPLALGSKSPYPATKAAAEAEVIGANGDGLETVVIRPRFVWGAGDTTLLPRLVAMTRAGQLRWIGGGRQLSATTHVANTVEGLVLGAQRGLPGNAYFVTDGSPVVFREFVSLLLATQGVEAPTGSVPLGVARAAAAVAETLWTRLPLPGEPPVARFSVWASGLECTLDDSKARDQLGYRPVITREQGLTELQAASA
jgi:nucleoside-diphosphate-sugar epimerase